MPSRMMTKASGILLHITSLPSPYGIGDFGPEAFRFVDFLAESRQGLWQILPLNPTRITWANSPYNSSSTFAGNPLLISPQKLYEQGYLSRSDIDPPSPFSGNRVDYAAATKFKERVLTKAYENFNRSGAHQVDFEAFCAVNADWLNDYTLFSALGSHFRERFWNRWPIPVRIRKEKELAQRRKQMEGPIRIEKYLQFLFFEQWTALKAYCATKGVRIIGDLPIYVHTNSADVWTNPGLFKLDEAMRPTVVSGVPPDYFSAAGQRWGNPIYRWDVHKETGYDWWIRRVAHHFKLFDAVRLDHFLGFVHYWEIPAREQTAANGKWVEGPGEDFFNALLKRFRSLPFIAEDLGVITPEVHRLRDRFQCPGMRILQFAFGNDSPTELHRPENYVPNCVAYTGTHDNDTLLGWLFGQADYSTRNPGEIRREREAALHYAGCQDPGKKDIHWEFIRLLMASAADRVVFPLQDVLGLGSEARMNRPGTTEGNWEWRLLPDQLTPSVVGRLAEITERYQRA